jgi:PIN domain nuclease of toxin-antitoxin system
LADQLLLDAHAFIWWREDNVRLNGSARQRIGTAAVVFVSVASAWEAAIKVALGKLKLPEPFEAGVEAAGFEQAADHVWPCGSPSECWRDTTAVRSIGCSWRRRSASG